MISVRRLMLFIGVRMIQTLLVQLADMNKPPADKPVRVNDDDTDKFLINVWMFLET